jgi:small subunit ribosomal protein S27Ae
MAEEKKKEAKAAPKAAKPKEKSIKPYVPHKACPKCGAGVHLAEHKDRRSCGKCGYFEKK